MTFVDLPSDVREMLAKVYRALYGAAPDTDDLNEYVVDQRSLIDDLAAYAVEHQRGAVTPANLFEDADFAAVAELLAIREGLACGVCSEVLP